MRTFAAASSKLAKFGTLQECIEWGEDLIAARKAQIVKILKCRPQEPDARIIFEITSEGVRDTPHGRVIKLALLRKAEKNGEA